MGRRPLRPRVANPALADVPVMPVSAAPLALVPEDREWIDRVRSGNQQAFEALVRLYARPLTAFAHRYVQSLSAAQAVVEDVFVRLWRGRHSWAFHGTVRGNLFASTHRVALEALHRMHRESRWHAGLPPDGPAYVPDLDRVHADDGVGADELEASVTVAIARLPGRSRVVAYMRWTDHLTRAEIATVLGMNVRTVHSQITPSAQAMRRRLGSPHDMINAWSTAPATREAIEGSERFTTIDPERIEMYLAGECIPAEQASLELDVVDAKGEPLALEAMRSAWAAPRLVVQRLVNEDEAWRTIARRLEIRYVGMEDDRAKGISLQSLDPRRLLRSRYFPRLPRPSISIPTIRPRQVAAFLALVAVALAAVAGVWTLATRQVSAGAATPATAGTVPAKGHAPAHPKHRRRTPPPASP
jgi:RNA polymerase sigma-70 factor (ECF subfamily)